MRCENTLPSECKVLPSMLVIVILLSFEWIHCRELVFGGISEPNA